MTRPSDLHWALVDARAFRVVRNALDAVAAAGSSLDYLLGGGWAVYAHAPVVPSVDCDLYLAEASAAFEADLRRRGLTVGPRSDVEFLDLDAPAEFLGFGDSDLGIPEATFVPRDVFRGEIEERMLPMDPPLGPVRVPSAPALSVAKAAALRGRSLGYAAHADGRARMLLGPDRVPMMMALSPTYYLRKAGKDFFDLSLLLAQADDLARFQHVVRDAGLVGPVRDTLREIPPPVIAVADDLASRAGRMAPSIWRKSVVP